MEETFEEGEGIGRAPGKSGKDPPLMDPSDLARSRLDDEVAQRHLPVTAHGNTIASAN
jgi:hypothetical protein